MKTVLCVLLCLLLTACTERPATAETYWQQEIVHLQPFAAIPQDPAPEEAAEADNTVHAVWIPVMQYSEWLTGKTEADLRETAAEAFARCADFGLNTVFLHIRAYGDAYYHSELFPPGSYLTGDYDPLAVLTEEAHRQGLSVHAWVNPLRLQTPEALAALPETYPTRQWLGTERIRTVDGHCWLDPAYPEVRELICAGVQEILDGYDVDGIHIDDYFYPTQDAAFDAGAFAESGASDLAEWRRGNCSLLVKRLYDTVKAQDERLIFSISPQGNLKTDYEALYADIPLWCKEPGYCDWMIPQLYYGFDNAVCPFTETLQEWQSLTVSAKLVVGLAPYKIGHTDQWAGTGSEEWLTCETVLSEEVSAVQAAGLGMAFYSYAALFAPDAQVAAERERIAPLLDKKSPPA